MTSKRSIIAALLALAACGSPPPAPGDAVVQVFVPGLDGEVSEVAVTATAPGLADPITATLAPGSEGGWTANLPGLPSGEAVVLTAYARSASGELLQSGSSALSVDPGATASASLALQAPAAKPVRNSPPVITALLVSDTTVAPSGTIRLEVRAFDPDGDALRYLWSAPAGSFSAPRSAITNWTAPSDERAVPITITVTDARGAETTARVTVKVARRRGDVRVIAVLNAAPLVDRILMTAQPPYLAPVRYALEAVAFDPDGAASAITYAWTVPSGSDCPGFFTAPTAARTVFVPAGVPPDGTCTARVTVSDARGGRSTGTLTFSVSQPRVQTAPRFVTGSQGAVSVSPSATVHFAAEFASPDGPLAVTWSSTPGGLGGLAPGTTSTATFPPACRRDTAGNVIPVPYAVIATASDPAGLTASHVFDITFCPAGSQP
jgi:hypothetical protein